MLATGGGHRAELVAGLDGVRAKPARSRWHEWSGRSSAESDRGTVGHGRPNPEARACLSVVAKVFAAQRSQLDSHGAHGRGLFFGTPKYGHCSRATVPIVC